MREVFILINEPSLRCEEVLRLDYAESEKPRHVQDPQNHSNSSSISPSSSTSLCKAHSRSNSFLAKTLHIFHYHTELSVSITIASVYRYCLFSSRVLNLDLVLHFVTLLLRMKADLLRHWMTTMMSIHTNLCLVRRR